MALALTIVVGATAATGPLPPPPTGLAQSWIAQFHLNGHVFEVGDIVTGTVTIPPIGDCKAGHRCVQRFSIYGAGLDQIGSCDKTQRTCRWRATEESEPWQKATMNISTDIGGAYSEDYFMVIDNRTFLLQGTVKSKSSGKGVSGIKVRVAGKQRMTATTDVSGFYALRLKKGVYTVTLSKPGEAAKFIPQDLRVSLVKPGKTTRNFVMKASFPSLFHAVDVNGQETPSGGKIGAVGDTVSYSGREWDPDGMVNVSWNGTRLGQHGGALFSGSWTLPVFPDGSCRGTLKATKGDTTKTLQLRASVWGQAAFASEDVRVGLFAKGQRDQVTPVKNGRLLKPGYRLCEGEGVVAGPKGAAIWANAQTFEVVNNPRRIRIWGGVATPDGSMTLAGGKRIGFNVAGNDPRGSDPRVRERQNINYLPSDLTPNPYTGSTLLSGHFVAPGDLTVTGPLHLDGADVFVEGNLSVVGDVTGIGSFIVMGDATFRGSMKLDAYMGDPYAINVGGKLNLVGR